MSGQIPPIGLFFWVCLSIAALGFGFFMAIIIHRGHLKTLEILRFYAEKGIEPPPAVVEMLLRHAGETEGGRVGRDLGTKAGNFVGMLIAACISGAVARWRMNEGGPDWLVYFFGQRCVLWGFCRFVTCCQISRLRTSRWPIPKRKTLLAVT